MSDSNWCGNCGGSDCMQHFDHQTFIVKHCGQEQVVNDLAGWKCKFCGEVVFDSASAKRYAEVGDKLVQEQRQ